MHGAPRAVLGFLLAAVRLKEVRRRGWFDKLGMSRPESVADHSYATAVLAMARSDEDGLDTAAALRMALLHDLAESETGDLVPGSVPREEKLRREDSAMARVLKSLPPRTSRMYAAAWREYRLGETREARLVREADKLEMAVQASEYARPGLDVEPFLESARAAVRDPHMQDILSEASLAARGRSRTGGGSGASDRAADGSDQKDAGQQ